jgi:signal transduction histidine kinase
MSVPATCVVFARVARNRRLAAFYVTAGLVFCSVVLVHLSGGTIEAHFHFFVLIGLIALYQDWVPFLWNVMFTVLSHGLGSVVGASIMFGHEAGQNRPWTWALIHGLAVLAACVGEIIFWKHTEQEQERNIQLVADLAAADAERREAMSELLVNLARRNQSLLNRQLEVITDLEVREREPEVLEELFRLDHLATRIRRNAESLLVLSGDDPARRWGRPVPLADVVRAAGAEVEDYRRVEVLVNDHIEVAGRAVADLAHLLAELVENATTFSPPNSNVRVRSHLSSGETVATVVSIEDSGIGMPDDELRKANTLLAEAPEVDLGRSTMLGFHVVARLAKRYGIEVRLAPTPGGGITAMVTLPPDMVSERPVAAVAADVATVNGVDRYQQAAVLARSNGSHRRALLEGSRAEPVPPRPAPVDERPRPRASELVSPWREIEVPARNVDDTVSQEDVDPFSTVVARWRQTQMEAAAAEQAGNPGDAMAAAAGALAALPPAPPAPPTEVPHIEPPAWWWESEAFVHADRTAPTVASPTPGPVPAPAAAPVAAPPPPTPEPATGVPTLANGLVRRVPGSHLAPSLRRDEADGPAPARDVPPPRSPEQVRSALSSFQSSQRAGRAAADADSDTGPPPVEGR